MVNREEYEGLFKQLNVFRGKKRQQEKVLHSFLASNRTQVNSFDIIAKLLVENNRLRDELVDKEKKISRLKERDQLTEVANRVKFYQELEKEMARLARQPGELAIIFIYIENFKELNDKYGHEIGNEVLKRLAGIIDGKIRELDTLARWGGNEFIILTPDISLNLTIQLGKRLKNAIYYHDYLAGKEINIRFGITAVRPQETYQDFIKRIDDILIEIKNKAKMESYISS